MKIFKRLVNYLFFNPTFKFDIFWDKMAAACLLFRWWSNINVCYVFAVKHFRNLTCWVDEQGVYLSFELLDLLMCGG